MIRAADRLAVGLLRRAGYDIDDPAVRRIRRRLHRGNRVQCPICAGRFRHFAATPTTLDERCWGCDSHARHRVLHLAFRQRPELLNGARDVLHFAPERALEQRLRRTVSGYVTADLFAEDVDRKLDLMALDVGDQAFDVVICSHVLEHVPDDRIALGELRRVVRPGGVVIVMVPINYDLPTTDEDPSVTDPAERARRFWQEDHVRLYGADTAQRLASAGFDVETIRPLQAFGATAVARHRLGTRNDVFACRPQPDAGSSPRASAANASS